MFKINKLSRIFIYRLEKHRLGNSQLTSFPTWHLREPSVYKTHRTSEPPSPELARGAHAHRPCLERKQWERREGASPAPRAPQLPCHRPRRTPPAASPPQVPPPLSPGARPTCGGAGKGLHLPNRVRAIVKALANCSPPPAGPRAPPRLAGDHLIGPTRSHLGRSKESEGRGGGAGARGGCRPGGRGPLQEKSYSRVIVKRTLTRGNPLALGEPALVAAICAKAERARAPVPTR